MDALKPDQAPGVRLADHARPALTLSTSPTATFSRLGDGDPLRGRRHLATLLWTALAGSPYARLPAYASIDAVLRGDLSHLGAVPERASPRLITATIADRLAGVFWGYELAAAPDDVQGGLRQAAARVAAGSSPAATGLDDLRPTARASEQELGRLVAELAAPRPRLFYADWVAVHPQFRGRGLARVLWAYGLDQALRYGGFAGYVARTLMQHRALLERFYCDEIGARALFAWEDDGLQRIAFGGGRGEALARTLARASRGVGLALRSSA